MIYYKFEYFNIPPPSKIQYPTPPVKFDDILPVHMRWAGSVDRADSVMVRSRLL